MISFRQILLTIVISTPIFLLIYLIKPFVIQPTRYFIKEYAITLAPYVLADFNKDSDSEIAYLKDYENHPSIEVFSLEYEYYTSLKPAGFYLREEPKAGTGDLDKDGYDEVYIVTVRNDSLFLDIFEPFDDYSSIEARIFLDTTRQVNGSYHVTCWYSSDKDLNGDKQTDLVIDISGGFSLYPRRLYVYEYSIRKLSKSQNTGINHRLIGFDDIDKDEKPEIFLFTQASENFQDTSEVEYDDYRSYLYILDDDLSYLFAPRIVSENKAIVFPFPRVYNDSIQIMAYYWEYRDKNENGIKIFNIEGRQTGLKTFLPGLKILPQYMDIEENLFIVTDRYNSIYIYGKDLQQKKVIKNVSGTITNYKNFNGFTNIYIGIGSNNEIMVFNKRFEVLNQIKINKTIDPTTINKMKIGNRDYLSLKAFNNLIVIDLIKNWIYAIRWIIWGLIYLSINLLFLSILYLQIRSIYKKNELNKYIVDLQMEAVNNQLQPHFTFNVLNNIGSLIYKNQKENAYKYLQLFSGILRTIIVQNKDSEWQIKDEIDFIQAYLAIEKLRFKELLEYEIHFDEKVDQNAKIPKLHIQAHVENAVKHGISAKGELGKVWVNIIDTEDSIIAFIEDDGVGYQRKVVVNQNNTGRGIEILRRYYDIYNANHKTKFELIISDRIVEGKEEGTSVHFKIPKNFT